ncbi:hypothetical protein [Roseobacter sp. HKCCA0434]|uniref:hypothetical protein n=1 Tax=Roseobacter sp. HKCCA0434 TaxID=3079297 RepID=UPI002905A251|nr:hypothetical protein [Roseobacter sp. HKCCA0434]
MRAIILAAMLSLSACAAVQEPQQPATPDVAQEVVQRILAMNCDELAATESVLSLVAQGQALARILLASGQLVGTGLTQDLIGQTEDARSQTGRLIDFMQLVRLCPRG